MHQPWKLPLQITSPLSLTIPKTADLGQQDGIDETTYIYGVNNAGTTELTVSATGVPEWITLGPGIDHGSLSGLADDDHTQYLLANGNRALTANWSAGAFQINLGPDLRLNPGGDSYFTGEVGFNLTNPTAKVHAKSVNAGGTHTIALQEFSGTDNILGISENATGVDFRLSDNTGTLRHRLHTDATGNGLYALTGTGGAFLTLSSGATGQSGGRIGYSNISGTEVMVQYVSSTGNPTLWFRFDTSAEINGEASINISADSDNDGTDHITFSTSGSERVRITDSGDVGIGTTNPAYPLDVDGDINTSGTYQGSDARFKENLVPVTGVLDKIKNIRGVYFNWNQLFREDLGRGDDQRHIGMIGQELETEFPELVLQRELRNDGGDDDESNDVVIPDARSIDYSRLTSVLVEAIKEQQSQIEYQKAQIDYQQVQMAELKQIVCLDHPEASFCSANRKRPKIRESQSDAYGPQPLTR